jgi:hypothetical protein
MQCFQIQAGLVGLTLAFVGQFEGNNDFLFGIQDAVAITSHPIRKLQVTDDQASRQLGAGNFSETNLYSGAGPGLLGLDCTQAKPTWDPKKNE